MRVDNFVGKNKPF